MINGHINSMVDHFADLIQLHYRSGRADTEFWKHQQTGIPMRPQLEYIQDICQHRWPNIYDWRQGYGVTGYGVFIYPMLEYDWINFDKMVFSNHRVQTEYENDIKSHRDLANDALTHTELVHRLQRGYIRPPTPSNILNQLHPLLRT
jgi:hypothetical protein